MLRMSADWAEENSCRGYYTNTRKDLEGNRIFFAWEVEKPAGYLLGHMVQAERSSTVMAEKTPYFEVEEIYVEPAMRSKGIGAALFRFAENAVRHEADYVLLSTATRNWRKILHFYIEELGMDFWNARLFKRLKEDG